MNVTENTTQFNELSPDGKYPKLTQGGSTNKHAINVLHMETDKGNEKSYGWNTLQSLGRSQIFGLKVCSLPKLRAYAMQFTMLALLSLDTWYQGSATPINRAESSKHHCAKHNYYQSNQSSIISCIANFCTKLQC
jgi:hypothetical protein